MKKRIIGLIGLMVLTANLFAGQVFYVAEGGAGNKDGTSWANAFADVQNAIDSASSAGGGEVWIAKGTYKHGSAMTMKNNVAIYGGFSGTETSKEERVAGNNTILDGEGKYRVFYNNYSSSSPLTNSAKLDNVTIQNGYASDGNDNSISTADDGAGMYNNYASPEITNCTFSGNRASSYGGGMYNRSSSNPELTNCTFSNNSASRSGGGMDNNGYNGTCNPVLTNCILWGNTALEDGNEIYNLTSNNNPTIDTCIIKGGKSGIYNSSYGTYTNIITADPKLMRLGNYGGSVQTCPVGEGSSAIGKGKKMSGVTTDALGLKRPSTPTIGAYEYNPVVPPFITTQPQAFDIYANNDGSLSVSATGEELTYQWYFNGEAIEGATDSSLSFDNIQADKRGEYYCVITNPAGSVRSNTVNVLVKPAPNISTNPTGFDVWSDTNQSLSVSATGEELTYQWYFNGEAIDGATESTLSFDNIQADKSGSYYCVVSNPAGSVKSEVVSVLVKPAPSITTQPEALDIFTNNDGSLSVVATGEELTYQWYFNGEAIEGATDSTLSFKDIQSDKIGSYYCIITNPAGSVQSSTANVVVRQSATEDSITKELEKVTTVSGTGYARFVVETTAYNPTYKWYYGSDSAGWTEFENETSNTLFIPAESKYNRKNIKCEISNGGGSVSTQAVLVYSSTAIQITSQPQDVSFKLNENASFDVTVSTSTGKAYYQWQYSADANEWQDIENATEATYSFKMMDSKNRGYYRCEIDNGGGVLYSENAKIIFPEDVAITKQPTAIISAIIGAKATFTVVVSGDDPKYKWQVSYDYGDTWENIAGATNATLNVDVVANVIENSYRCLIWNDNNIDAPLESEMVWIENVIEPTAFQEWSMANGLGIDASPSATPHNDGITNLEKFAFGLDASKATSYDANANFKHTSDATGTTLEFPVSVDAEGVVQVKTLKSVDLINWVETTATATGETSSDGKFKIYKVTAPVGEEGKVFLKLKVEEK